MDGHSEDFLGNAFQNLQKTQFLAKNYHFLRSKVKLIVINVAYHSLNVYIMSEPWYKPNLVNIVSVDFQFCVKKGIF